MTAALVALLIALYALAVNVAAYGLFAIDKQRARANEWRISEATLLGSAIAGGSIGAKLAQHRLRHKTRKEPFRSMLNLICLLQCMALASLLFPAPRAAVVAFAGPIVDKVAGLVGPDNAMPHRFGPGS